MPNHVLTPPQRRALVAIGRGGLEPQDSTDYQWRSLGALKRRGLADNNGWRWHLTEAGLRVLEEFGR